jgi:NADH:ubiquinone oxidoreductase subunit E
LVDRRGVILYIDNRYQLMTIEALMRNLTQSKDIKVCSGPGCKAWASEKIARQLEGLETEGYKVCRVACMRKCGGGATVKAAISGELLKMRNPEEVLQVLFSGNPSPALAFS